MVYTRQSAAAPLEIACDSALLVMCGCILTACVVVAGGLAEGGVPREQAQKTTQLIKEVARCVENKQATDDKKGAEVLQRVRHLTCPSLLLAPCPVLHAPC